jgi:hypothetical protein
MWSIISTVAGPLVKGLFGVIDQAVEDKDKAAEIKSQIQTTVLETLGQTLEAAKQIIIAEASGGFLQRNWRPLTMITFVVLIVAKWLGFTAPGISEAVELQLFEIIKIGLGGYVVGRSAEKIVPQIAEMLKR